MSRRLLPAAVALALLATGCAQEDPIEALARDVVEQGVRGDGDGLGVDATPAEQASAPVDEPASNGAGAPAPFAGSADFGLRLAGGGAQGAGDTVGSGEGGLTFHASDVCHTLVFELDSDITGLHLHEGPPGAEGDLVANLSLPVGGAVDACTDLDTELVERILAEPSRFYVNVHTAAFPSGAIRAQLG